MSFPQLLRRSSFAQHDPLITRIYTSTQSSISQSGDWGLKYPIHRPAGPKYIKVHNLDGGPAVGTDYRSGEKEARFTQAWGTGRVRWIRRDTDVGGKIGRGRSQRDNYDRVMSDDPPPSGTTTGRSGGASSLPGLVPDIESMTPAEFERHLDGIRSRRKEFLPVRLAEMDRPEWRDEDLTLINLAIGGHSKFEHGANMQASMVQIQLESQPQSSQPQSNTKAILHSVPHPTGGLYYSTSPSPRPVQSRTIPGRALNRKDRMQAIWDRATGSQSQNNLPYVVSVGGLTASAKPSARISSGTGLAETDYTRTEPEKGKGQFKVAVAAIESLPTVINLQSSDLARRYDQYPISKAKRAAPLDTFNFNIDLDLAETADGPGGGGEGEVQPGSAEWVAREPAGRPRLTPGDRMGMAGGGAGGPGANFGGRKNERVKGAAVKSLAGAHQSQRKAVDSIRDLITRRPGMARQR